MNVPVGPAAAQVSGQFLAQLCVVAEAFSRPILQTFHVHDLAWRAEAALHGIVIDESGLHGIELIIAAHTLYRYDIVALAFRSKNKTRVHCASIEQHGARTTITGAATLFSPVQRKAVAQ